MYIADKAGREAAILASARLGTHEADLALEYGTTVAKVRRVLRNNMMLVERKHTSVETIRKRRAQGANVQMLMAEFHLSFDTVIKHLGEGKHARRGG